MSETLTLDDLSRLSQPEIRHFIQRICNDLEMTPSELAVQSDLAASTLTRFMYQDVSHTLSMTTLRKIIDTAESIKSGAASIDRPMHKMNGNGAELILKIDRAVTLDQAARIFAILDEKP